MSAIFVDDRFKSEKKWPEQLVHNTRVLNIHGSRLEFEGSKEYGPINMLLFKRRLQNILHRLLHNFTR